MAKKASKEGGGGNKAKTIRDYAEANPGAGPKAISAALKEQAVDATPAYVSTILALARKAKRKGKKAVGRPAGGGAGGDYLSVLIRAKKLAEQLGGVDKAKAALDALAKLGA
jgi:hypothetical protein